MATSSKVWVTTTLARISHEEIEKGCLFSGISVFVRKTCAQEGGQPLVYRV
jgi:hypothetical protein